MRQEALEKKIKENIIMKNTRLTHRATCQNCDFDFGPGCLPSDPTYRHNISTQFFDAFFDKGVSESICPRCEDPVSEIDIYPL